MGFFSNLLKSGEDPELALSDPVLGPLTWSDHHEAWLGEHNGFKFAFTWEYKNVPDEDVIAYAREILNDPAWLISTLDNAKPAAKKSRGEFYVPEIDRLTFEILYFSVSKKTLFSPPKPSFTGFLAGGDPNRSWRIEYTGRQCEGIGFDS